MFYNNCTRSDIIIRYKTLTLVDKELEYFFESILLRSNNTNIVSLRKETLKRQSKVYL